MTTIPRTLVHMHPGHENETNCTIPHDHRAANIEWLDQTLAALCFVTAAASVALNVSSTLNVRLIIVLLLQCQCSITSSIFQCGYNFYSVIDS